VPEGLGEVKLGVAGPEDGGDDVVGVPIEDEAGEVLVLPRVGVGGAALLVAVGGHIGELASARRHGTRRAFGSG
jgi:hypothetical protein